ncbi:hypothetical protein C8R44DRAFT_754546 [Mycena epipterygia]|nr:hypothetical protein C8R44DRAFT_754546 [Mycena epipterygia]
MDANAGLTTEEQLQWFKDYAATLEKQALEAKHHDGTVMELISEAEELRYSLSVARGEQKDTAAKLLWKEYQFYDLRRAIWQVGLWLTARESYKSTENVAEQLAESQRFIASIGGLLEDEGLVSPKSASVKLIASAKSTELKLAALPHGLWEGQPKAPEMLEVLGQKLGGRPTRPR